MYGKGVPLPEWHPIQHAGRVENLAIRRESARPYRYLMGCGHYSLPNKTVCERGCLESPNWSVPVVRHPEWDPYLKRAYRTDRALERRLNP
jgi:hypothetical protein